MSTMSTPNTLSGFEEARVALRSHEARVRAHELLHQLFTLDDERIAAIHVDTSCWPERIVLTAFEAGDNQGRAETLSDDDGRDLEAVAAFRDHRVTSELDGWVIDMKAVRTYDASRDRHQTQRAMMLAHLGDLIAAGEVDVFNFGSSSA